MTIVFTRRTLRPVSSLLISPVKFGNFEYVYRVGPITSGERGSIPPLVPKRRFVVLEVMHGRVSSNQANPLQCPDCSDDSQSSISKPRRFCPIRTCHSQIIRWQTHFAMDSCRGSEKPLGRLRSQSHHRENATTGGR